MIKRFAFLFSILLLILSLAGCGSTDDSKQATNNETKTVEVTTAKADNKHGQAPKQQSAPEPLKTTAASTEATTEEPVEKKTVSEESPAAVKESPAPTTKTTTNNNKTTSATKPAAAPSSKTTSTPAKTTTNTTTNAAQKTTTSTATNTTTPVPKPAAPAPKPVSTVTLSIMRPDGAILSASKVKINTGYTIFDVVKQGAKEKGIAVDSTGSGATAYIEGIDNIYEFDYGAKSGWVFKLNGVSINRSVGAIKVKAGDRIGCYYTK